MEDLTGKQLGPYQIIASIGEGGMATVYKAYQPGMDRYVALKILPRHFADPQFVARFRQEARVLAKLQHPHILPVFDFGEADGYTYLVMPFVESGTLTDLLKGRPLPLTQIRNIISQVGDALDYAHAHGLVHRDVKPSNVLIDERGNCLLSDFGLAKIIEGDARLTTSGAIMGTPAYMSPEQGMGQKIDGRSDIYALGAILYEMAVGRVPHSAETPMAVVIKHISDPLPPPRTVNPALPESVERVILKALAKSPEDRYQTAGEMVRAIQVAILDASATEAAVPISTAAATPAPETRTKPTTERLGAAVPTRIFVVGGAILLVGFVVLLGASIFNRRAPQVPTISPTVPVKTSEPTSVPTVSANTGEPTTVAVLAPTAQTVTSPIIIASPTVVSPPSTQAEPVHLQYEQDGFQTGVTLSFVADVWSKPRIGDPGVNGDRQTQLVMGEHVLILGETDLWYQIVAVEQPSSKDRRGYPGWVQKSDVVAGWPLASEYVVVTEPVASLFASPDGRLLGEVPFDARLPVLETQQRWVHVGLPDSRDGWLSLREVRITGDLSVPYAVDDAISTARKFIGAPYLWGGTTAHGFDCSGFLYRVFHIHGITLSRDSRDMASNGSPVSRDLLQAGDIVFTSGRADGVVSHTALYIGEGQVIETIGAGPVGIQTLTKLTSSERFVNATRVTP